MKIFKIGDRVKVIGKISGAARLLPGRIGKVIKVVLTPGDREDCGGGYVCLDIEAELGREGGGIWFDDVTKVKGDEWDLSHIKQYPIVKFLETLNAAR